MRTASKEQRSRQELYLNELTEPDWTTGTGLADHGPWAWTMGTGLAGQKKVPVS